MDYDNAPDAEIHPIQRTHNSITKWLQSLRSLFVLFCLFPFGVVAHAFNSSTQEGKAVDLYDSQASLISILSSRTLSPKTK